MADNTVKGSEGSTGDRGEVLLARGEQLALRKWEGEPEGTVAPPHANPYEYVAYLVEGAMRIRIGDEPERELAAGDSYVVPADTEYTFEVLQRATVVEAVTVSAQ
jgi:quercetin dioxygenase-like cupin family protein